jgi:peptidoglycan hydrolase-like protein with peptidoglycan-binding domain
MDALFKPDQRQKIQARLKAKGFLAANAPAAFGTETRGAIRQYQASIGAQPTGYLTPPQFLQLIGE